MRERRIRDFYAQCYHLADETKRSIANERTWEKARFTQNLETVACAKNEFSPARVADHRLHDRGEACDGAAT